MPVFISNTTTAAKQSLGTQKHDHPPTSTSTATNIGQALATPWEKVQQNISAISEKGVKAGLFLGTSSLVPGVTGEAPPSPTQTAETLDTSVLIKTMAILIPALAVLLLIILSCSSKITNKLFPLPQPPEPQNPPKIIIHETTENT